MTLTLAQARTILDAALAHARAQQAQPLAIIILDVGAHPIAFAREDGASLFRFDIARAKASGASCGRLWPPPPSIRRWA